MADREKAVREVRILHGAFVTTVFLFVLAVHVADPPERHTAREIVLAIAFVTLADITIGFVLRSRFMGRATEALRSQGEEKALQAWRFANIYSFAHAETVALFGVMLKFIGASWKVAAPFLVVSLALQLLWTPRLDWPFAPNPAPPPAPVA